MRWIFLLVIAFTIPAIEPCTDGTDTCPPGKVCCTEDGRTSCCDQIQSFVLPKPQTESFAATTGIIATYKSAVAVLSNIQYSLNSTLQKEFGTCSPFICGGGTCCSDDSCCSDQPNADCCKGDRCCQTGTHCCDDGGCCSAGSSCCGTRCCEDMGTCCKNGEWCCKAGNVCGRYRGQCFNDVEAVGPKLFAVILMLFLAVVL